MKFTRARKVKISERLNLMVESDTPLRDLVGNLSRFARLALAEANSLSIEKIDISLKRLPKKLDGIRLVHLSDIHHSPFTNLQHIARAIAIANTFKPDMFILTGDYVSHHSEYIKPVAKVLGKLNSKFGTFACLGNHDHWTDPALIVDSLRSENIKVLINQGFRFEAEGASFWLAGVDDHMVGRTDLQTALRGSYPDEMKMLLAHNPVILRQAAMNDVDVIFSGHTHGGQVKLRDNESQVFNKRRLRNGLHRRNNTQIYITRGIGTVVLPIRFQCPPEISLIELKST